MAPLILQENTLQKESREKVCSYNSVYLQRETEYFVSQILVAAPCFSKAIPKIFQAIGENLGWEVGLLWKVDTVLQKIRCCETWVAPGIEAPEFFEATRKSLFSPGIELPGRAWESKKARWIIDLTHTSNSLRADLAAKGGLKSAFCFPISWENKILGIMEFFSLETKVFDKGFLKMFDVIGGQISQFIEGKEKQERLKFVCDEMEKQVQARTIELLRTNVDLRKEIIERKKIENQVLEIAQKEQRRFGAQLHDGLCQELTGILMYVKGLARKMEQAQHLEITELNKISDMLHDAIRQARDTARGLYPGELEGTSLMLCFQALISRTQTLTGISCQFHCPQSIVINDNNIATHLYRIAQEGINNAVTHGKAKKIEMSLIKSKESITFTLKDDGIGFVSNGNQPKGIGLHIMKYRAHMMDASFMVKHNLPHGVTLQCILKNPQRKTAPV
ncbi:MAG: Multi-sensor signal transduction histidine kinase [uncultured bacterium]|nr:MAG: Multi-sensor signal transduction histidine kinase [uncultured bacterium]